VSQLSPTNTNQSSWETANPILAGSRLDTISVNNVQFGQQDGNGLYVDDSHDFRTEDLANFGPLYEPNDAQNGLWLDQAMMDIGMQGFDHMDACPNEVPAERAGVRSAISPQGVETTSIVCGLTGDMDPYLMQRYDFDHDNDFVFKKLTVRSMSQDVYPVQLLVSNATGDINDTANDTTRDHLERLVSPDVGIRLISLYAMHIPWQICTQHG
jgi:hypothetical protein